MIANRRYILIQPINYVLKLESTKTPIVLPPQKSQLFVVSVLGCLRMYLQVLRYGTFHTYTKITIVFFQYFL